MDQTLRTFTRMTLKTLCRPLTGSTRMTWKTLCRPLTGSTRMTWKTLCCPLCQVSMMINNGWGNFFGIFFVLRSTYNDPSGHIKSSFFVLNLNFILISILVPVTFFLFFWRSCVRCFCISFFVIDICIRMPFWMIVCFMFGIFDIEQLRMIHLI